VPGTPEATLRLPIEDPPQVPWETDLDNWVRIDRSEGRDVTEQLQAAIDAAAQTGKTTVYFSRGEGNNRFRISAPIRVHGSVNRIIGMNILLEIEDRPAFEDSAAFVLEDLDHDAFIFERFFQIGGWDRPNVHAIENRTDATVILRNLNFTSYGHMPRPGGRWFLDDASPGRGEPLTALEGEQVWARQFNPESPRGDAMILVDGGTLWLLGIKTEGRSTHVEVRNGGRAEVLGGVSYQSWDNQDFDPPVFIVDDDSQLSATLGFYHWQQPFTTIVRQQHVGETLELPRRGLPGYHLPMFRAGGGGDAGDRDQGR
jgi:hypothetical protein